MRAIVRYLLLLTAGIAGLALGARACFGPYSFLLSVRSPMNAESIFAAALVLLFVFSPRSTDSPEPPVLSRFDWLSTAAICLGTLVIYWPSLFVPFVADDYAHILNVSKADVSYVLGLFTVPASDRFFRPLGMISYLIDVQWAGFSPVRWHIAAVLLHALNTTLLYWVCRRLGLPMLWALFGAAFFGVHASRPETVTWISARFDLLATLFVLVALLCFLSRAPLALLLAVTLCGLLSKESAYVLPLLLAVVVLFRKEFRSAASYRAIGACAALTAAVFVYRWILLSGIGGYHDPQGQPTIFLVNLWLLFKALGLRLWAVLFFPVNWTDPLALPLKAAFLIMIVALLGLAAKTRMPRLGRLGLALTLLAALPVQHLLLIGPDLEKSRVVYLGSAGFALAFAALLQSAPRKLAMSTAAAVLAFQTLALWHNLNTWNRVGRIHVGACDTLAAAVAESGGEVFAVDMPNVHDGVYMLKTGLSECVEVRHGLPRERLLNVLKSPTPSAPVFVWNKQTQQVERRWPEAR